MEIAEGILLDPGGAMILREDRLLAIADLHVGYEASFRASGAGIPDHGTEELLARIQTLLRRHDPATVLVNGDFKHGFRRRLPDEARDARRVLAALKEGGRNVILVAGNHDPGLEGLLEHPVVARSDHGRVRFAHGHVRVGRPRGGWLVLGHEHPAITLHDPVGIRLRVPAFLVDPGRRLVVLPAMSAWAAGYAPAARGKFLSPALAGVAPGAFEAFALDGDEIYPFGTLSALERALRDR